MKRVCFTLRIRPGKVDDYLAAHEVWPEMRAAISAAGMRNYSIFIDRKKALAVGYFEAEDPEKSLRELGKTDVNARWQAHMNAYIAGGGDMRGGGLTWLEQFFYEG